METLAIGMLVFYFAAYILLCSRAADLHPGFVDVHLKNPKFHVELHGLRGLLAISVFFHHAMVSFWLYKNAAWSVPNSKFFAFLGDAPVQVFFFFTGYLFWVHALGKEFRLEWRSYAWARLRRIAPNYYASVFLIVFCVLWVTSFRLQEPIFNFVQNTLNWLFFGLPYPNFPPINAYRPTFYINAGVAWTLRQEVIFYLFFPLLCRIVRAVNVYWVLLFFFSIAYFKGVLEQWNNDLMIDGLHGFFAAALEFSAYFASSFSIGIICAELAKRKLFLDWLGSWRGRWYVLFFSTAVAYFYCRGQSSLWLISFGFIFYAVVGRQNFFGFLRNRGLLLLGSVSYSTYIFHGIILFLMGRILIRFAPWILQDLFLYWLQIFFIGIFVILFSCVAYLKLEYPMMKIGRE